MEFYCYITKTPEAPGLSDALVAGDGRTIHRDLKTVRGVVNRMRRLWPGKSFKVFSFTNFYDNKTFRHVHTERA